MKDPLKILTDVEQPEPRRIEAAKALAKSRDLSAIDRMLAEHGRVESILGRAIVEALKEMGAHEVLAKRLKDADPAVRADAAKKLVKLQDERAIEPLAQAARDPEPAVRRGAVGALSYLKGSRVYDTLVAALRDEDPETRAYAAAGLGRIGDGRAPRVLSAAREAEQDEVVRDFIDAAIRKLPKEASPAK